MDHLIEVTSQLIMPIMLLCFFSGLALRVSLYYISREELKFATEFFKRVTQHFSNPKAPRVESFQRLIRILMVKTHLECFETKNKYRRRNLDSITGLTERLFLIEDGIKRLIQDTMAQTRYLKKGDEATESVEEQKLLGVSKSVYENNPYFNRLIGIFSVGLLNDILNILPSLFIIGGIFGTFLGISRSLPDLSGMDLSNMDETKRIMDLFLIKISQSMIKSIIGIAFSVIMSVVNTVFSVETIHYQVVNKFTDALQGVWHETSTNERDRAELFPETIAEPISTDKKVA